MKTQDLFDALKKAAEQADKARREISLFDLEVTIDGVYGRMSIMQIIDSLVRNGGDLDDCSFYISQEDSETGNIEEDLYPLDIIDTDGNVISL